MKDLGLLGLFENRDYIVTRVPYGQHLCVGMAFTFDAENMEFVSKEDIPRYIPLYKVVMHGFSLMLASDCNTKLIEEFKAMADFENKQANELGNVSNERKNDKTTQRVVLYNERGMGIISFDDIVFYCGEFYRPHRTQQHIDLSVSMVQSWGTFKVEEWDLLSLSSEEWNSLIEKLKEQENK